MLHGGFERIKTINTYKPIPTSHFIAGSVGSEGLVLDSNGVCYVTGAAKEQQEQGERRGVGVGTR